MKRTRAKRLTAAKSQQAILNWAKKNGRTPMRSSENKRERLLAYKMNNFLSKECPSYDAAFRATIVKTYGIKFNPKGKHDPKQRIRDLIAFIKEHGRTPSRNLDSGPVVSALGNFTTPTSPLFSEAVLEKVRRLDKCHGSLIPRKYRQSINTALSLSGKRLKDETK